MGTCGTQKARRMREQCRKEDSRCQGAASQCEKLFRHRSGGCILYESEASIGHEFEHGCQAWIRWSKPATRHKAKEW